MKAYLSFSGKVHVSMNAGDVIRRLTRPIRIRVERRGRVAVAAGAAAVAVLCAALVAAALVFLPASADEAIEGQPVDSVDAQTIMVAALACPMLTGPRLAATMMAATGMDLDADGGVAGMSAVDFAQWSPWPNASISDPTANTYALAHYLCDLAGRARVAGSTGDPWEAALAAFHASQPVTSATASASANVRQYVKTVNGYAVWYARQPEFMASADASHLASPDSVAVPADRVDAIVAAGRVCPEITPSMVAAQLAASSGFDVNLRAPTQAMGIAQFLPDMWMQYAPSVTSSPWDASTAIGVMGATMCDLTHRFADIDKDNGYAMALAAFRVGATAVRQAGGVPPIAVVQRFISRVRTDAGAYAKDSRLSGAGTPTPAPSAGPSGTPTPTSSGRPTPKPTSTLHSPGPTTGAPPGPPPTTGGSSRPTGPITGLGGLCIDIPNTADGTQLEVWGCDNAATQQWTVEADGSIHAMGKCLDIAAGSVNNTKVQIHTCNGNAHQQWTPRSDGSLYNANTDKCLDVYSTNFGWGSLLAIWTCNHQSNQVWNLPS